MFRNRNKLSALTLAILLSALSLGTALAAESGKENDTMARNYQQDAGVPCADSNKQMDSTKDKTDNNPDTWYDRQLRIQHG